MQPDGNSYDYDAMRHEDGQAPRPGAPAGGNPYGTIQPMQPDAGSYNGNGAYNGNGTGVAANGAVPAHEPWNTQEPAQRSFDPESTAAWSLAEDPPSGPYAMPQQPGTDPTVRDAWSTTPEDGSRNGESIVPDSWFAGPRVSDPREAEAQGPAMWTPPPPDTEATMQAPWGAQSPMPAPPAGTQQFGPPPGAQQFGPPPGPQSFGGPDQGTQQFGPLGGPQQFSPGPGGPGWAPEPQPQHDWAAGPVRNETALLPGPGGGLPPGYPPGQLPHGPGSGLPGGGPPKRSEAGRSLIIAVCVLVVAAVAAVAVVIMWPGGGVKSPASSASATGKKTTKGASGAHAQAVAVNAILNASGTSRGGLGRALTAAHKCDGLAGAIAEMQTVAQQREQQLSQTKALKVDALANGTRMRTTLAKAINYSLDVDKAYLAWAQAAQNGCQGRPKANADSKRGAHLSAQASAAKQQFSKLWAPVAQKEGLPRRGPTSF
jgi:hypothetical protein